MKEIKSEDFETEVLKAKGKILIDFNADWCGPCQMMKPILTEFADKHDDIAVIGVNIDENPDLAARYQVSGIPCLVVMEDGEEINRGVGVHPLKKLEKLVGV